MHRTYFVITMQAQHPHSGHSMNKTAVYQLRLSQQEKQQAFAVLAEIGISPAQAIRLFLRQVVVTRSIPFGIEAAQHLPTLAAAEPRTNSPTVSTAQALKPLDTPAHLQPDADMFDHLDGLLSQLD